MCIIIVFVLAVVVAVVLIITHCYKKCDGFYEVHKINLNSLIKSQIYLACKSCVTRWLHFEDKTEESLFSQRDIILSCANILASWLLKCLMKSTKVIVTRLIYNT